MSAAGAAGDLVIATYRGLLRAVAATFRGDAAALAQGRAAASAAFRGWSGAAAARPAALAEAADAAAFLRSHVAQARLNGRGAYELALAPPDGPAPANVHLQHARDVEDPSVRPADGGCCGGGCR